MLKKDYMDNQNKSIKLNWRGPVDFDKLEDDRYMQKWNSDMNNAGIYLHCYEITLQQKYAITYVGISDDSIIERNKTHLSKTKNGECTLFNFKDKDINFDIIYCSAYLSFEDKKKYVEPNIKTCKLFYATHTKEKFITDFGKMTKKRVLLPLEGALQFELWRKEESRKYLITSVSNYSLKKLTSKIILMK